MSKVNEMMKKCDELAASYWQQGASGKELAYKLWQNQVKKTVEFIEFLEINNIAPDDFSIFLEISFTKSLPVFDSLLKAAHAGIF